MEQFGSAGFTKTEPSPEDAKAAKAMSYLEGMPILNIGALFMPPIWGPAKGIWATILWYPAWMMADNCLYAWYSVGDALSAFAGIVALVLLVAATVAFAYFSRPIAAERAVSKGKTREEFQRGEHIWAVVSILLGIVFLGFATYYNLVVRTPLIP